MTDGVRKEKKIYQKRLRKNLKFQINSDKNSLIELVKYYSFDIKKSMTPSKSIDNGRYIYFFYNRFYLGRILPGIWVLEVHGLRDIRSPVLTTGKNKHV